MPIGKVKFYNSVKGYGFIHDNGSAEDVHFHILAVLGPDAPSVGDTVSFEMSLNNGRQTAVNINIIEHAKLSRKKKALDGFPCVRSESISGFRVERHLGSISAGNGLFWTYYSVNDAREAIIEEAKKLGANALLNFVRHREKRTKTYSTKRWFGNGYNYHHSNSVYFWCEGDAVFLISID
jgi:cold shock CspA family protein